MFHDNELDRRGFFNWGIQGLGATALACLLGQQGANAGEPDSLADPRRDSGFPNFAPRAKRAIHICLVGGLSHLDSFDYKPELERLHGKSLETEEQPDIFFGQVGLLRKSDWAFGQHGQSGLWVSDLFPNLANVADELTVIRSMYSDSANHTPALFFANSGFQFNGFPSLGSWLSYGLGNESDELPTYVVLPDGRGGPNGGASNWTNGFLPAQHQGVVFSGGERPVRDLFPASNTVPGADRALRQFIQKVNQGHLERSGEDQILLGRIRSYELAAKMQLSVPEVGDLSSEPAYVRSSYGLDQPGTEDCGRRCLMARRLLERGVRFVQVFSGGPIAGTPRTSWDAHEDVHENHSAEAALIDQPIAALIKDLKQRGMLEDTLVLFTTEFGRTPFTQSAADQVGKGRDHNRYAFSVWMAGAGLKPGLAYGETDDIGWKTTQDAMSWHDFHATVLHLFGIDHERLTYYHNGIQRRLTNVHGVVANRLFS